MTPGLTGWACDFIPTMGNPVRVPLCCIPAQYCEEVDRQLEEMLHLGIITESNSPWMAQLFTSGRRLENYACVTTTRN